MPSPGTPEDPRSGRDRRVVTKRRTFKHGTIDPVSEHRRPLFTWGNAILVIIMIGFALYATGNLPQLDAFFDHLNDVGRSHNNAVVGAIITYGPYLFGAVVLAVVALFVFLFINSSRRQHSDPKGWHKVADAPPERRRISRRLQDLPSMVMPLGKRPPAAAKAPIPTATSATAEALPPARVPSPNPIETAAPSPAKAAAIAEAAKAEAALETASPSPPSFVRPLGKTPTPKPTGPPEPVAATPTATPPTNAATTAKLEAAVAAAKAAAAQAEATIAAAKAEAAIAAAKAEAAAAEAALAAAKAEAAISGS